MMKECKGCGQQIKANKVFCNQTCYLKNRDPHGGGRKKYVRQKCGCGCGLIVPALKQLYYNREHMCDFKNRKRLEAEIEVKKRKEKKNKYLNLIQKDRRNSVLVIDKAFKRDIKAIQALLQLQVTKLIRHGKVLNLLMEQQEMSNQGGRIETS